MSTNEWAESHAHAGTADTVATEDGSAEWLRPEAARAGSRACGAVWNRLDVCASSPACSVSAASHRASLWPAALPLAHDAGCEQKGV